MYAEQDSKVGLSGFHISNVGDVGANMVLMEGFMVVQSGLFTVGTEVMTPPEKMRIGEEVGRLYNVLKASTFVNNGLLGQFSM